MNIHTLQHVPFEGPGSIGAWAEGKGHALTVTRMWTGEPPPEPAAFDWLVVMGGPMGVHDTDRHTWLADETRFIDRTISAGKTVIGICLGAQLLAHVMGARVHRNRHREIGWFPVTLTEAGRRWEPFQRFPDRPEVFHWHGDTFDIPSGATLLAGSDACPHQAFQADGRLLGLQFHLETTLPGARELVAHCRDELDGGPYVQGAEAMLADTGRFRSIHGLMDALLNGLEGGASHDGETR